MMNYNLRQVIDEANREYRKDMGMYFFNHEEPVKQSAFQKASMVCNRVNILNELINTQSIYRNDVILEVKYLDGILLDVPTRLMVKDNYPLCLIHFENIRAMCGLEPISYYK